MVAVEGWTVDTLATHIERQLEDMRAIFDQRVDGLEAMLSERYFTQTKAVDNAFAAAEKALTAALAAAEKAVQTALAAAEKAAVKAELAADKRFEVVTDKMDETDRRLQVSVREINSRLDLTQGRSSGLDKGWAWIIGVVVTVSTVINVIVQVRQ